MNPNTKRDSAITYSTKSLDGCCRDFGDSNPNFNRQSSAISQRQNRRIRVTVPIFAVAFCSWVNLSNIAYAQNTIETDMKQLRSAVENRQVDRVKILLERGTIDLNTPTSENSYVLDLTMRRYADADSQLYEDDLEIFKLLINAGARRWNWSSRQPHYQDLTYAQLWAAWLIYNPWGDLGIDKLEFLIKTVFGHDAMLWDTNKNGDDFLMWFCREGLYPTTGTKAQRISWYQGMEMTHRPGMKHQIKWTPAKVWEMIITHSAKNVGTHIILIKDLNRVDKYINEHLSVAGAGGCPAANGSYPVGR